MRKNGLINMGDYRKLSVRTGHSILLSEENLSITKPSKPIKIMRKPVTLWVMVK